jgi:hypothetical protein
VPYFSLAETGVFHRVEGPRGFATWGEADEASRFLLVPE